jgi:hypothetical protein
VKGWASGFQGGSSSIIEAISIRSSGSWRTSSAVPCPHQSIRGGAGRSAEAVELPPPDHWQQVVRGQPLV